MELYKFDDILREIYTEEEIIEIKKKAQFKVNAFLDSKNNLKRSLEDYMKENNISLNEIIKRMHTSPSQVMKIKKGQANVTLATIVELASLMGKQPYELIAPKKD